MRACAIWQASHIRKVPGHALADGIFVGVLQQGLSPMPLSRNLHRLIYRSQATPMLHEADLPILMQKARSYNYQEELGGLLLYFQGQFLQVLEGPEPALSNLYARIQADPRHHDLHKLSYDPIAARTFPDWRMGFATATADLLERVTGVLPLLAAPGLAAHPPEELALLLRDFALTQPQDD